MENMHYVGTIRTRDFAHLEDALSIIIPEQALRLKRISSPDYWEVYVSVAVNVKEFKSLLYPNKM